MAENLKDKLYEKVIEREKDLYFEDDEEEEEQDQDQSPEKEKSVEGSRAGSALASVKNSAVGDENESNDELQEGGSSIGSDNEDVDDLMTREEEI